MLRWYGEFRVGGKAHFYLECNATLKSRASISFDPNQSPIHKLHAFDIEIFSNGGCSLCAFHTLFSKMYHSRWSARDVMGICLTLSEVKVEPSLYQ
jgi:hypothetical protein